MLYEALPIKQIPDSLVCGVDSTLIMSENSINYQQLQQMQQKLPPNALHCSDSLSNMKDRRVLGDVPVNNELIMNNLNYHNLPHNQNEQLSISNYLSSSLVDNYNNHSNKTVENSSSNISNNSSSNISSSSNLTLKNKLNSTSNNRNHIITDTLPGPESCV